MPRPIALLLLTAITGCLAGVDDWPTATGPLDIDSYELFANPFGASVDGDRDGDCIDDLAEHMIAVHFEPLFVFDSRENARRHGEPVMLYQVHPMGRRGACDVVPARVEVTYAYLFADDGGYAESVFCDDHHAGDDQYLRFVFDVAGGGARLSLRSVWAWGFSFPNNAMQVSERAHPVIYLSAGKHHPYFDTRVDGRASPYSHWNCREAMDGRGDVARPLLESAAAPRRFMNVGEPASHDPSAFVVDLGAMGFPGESAWGAAPFCGGHHSDGCESNNPMRAIWD